MYDTDVLLPSISFITLCSKCLLMYDVVLTKDMIATLGETTGYPGLLYTKRKMESDPVGRQILK